MKRSAKTAKPEMGDAVLEQAIDWMMHMRDGQPTDQERQAFDAWREESAEHAQVYARLTHSVERFDLRRHFENADLSSVQRVLEQPVDRRGALAKLVSVGAVSVTAAAVASQLPLSEYTADIKTSTGRREVFTLLDGSVATLNARSAADFVKGANGGLRLLSGEVLVDAAASAGTAFNVLTPQGRIAGAGAGASFSVRLLDDAADVAVRRASVVLHGAGRAESLKAGQRARLAHNGPVALGAVADGEFSWTRGYYEALDRPLGEVIEMLRRYRPGIIHMGPGVATLQVTGAFPLDDTWRALSALAGALPVQVRQFSPYLVAVTRR